LRRNCASLQFSEMATSIYEPGGSSSPSRRLSVNAHGHSPNRTPARDNWRLKSGSFDPSQNKNRRDSKGIQRKMSQSGLSSLGLMSHTSPSNAGAIASLNGLTSPGGRSVYGEVGGILSGEVGGSLSGEVGGSLSGEFGGSLSGLTTGVGGRSVGGGFPGGRRGSLSALHLQDETGLSPQHLNSTSGDVQGGIPGRPVRTTQMPGTQAVGSSVAVGSSEAQASIVLMRQLLLPVGLQVRRTT
jgi:hypothetical protein